MDAGLHLSGRHLSYAYGQPGDQRIGEPAGTKYRHHLSEGNDLEADARNSRVPFFINCICPLYLCKCVVKLCMCVGICILSAFLLDNSIEVSDSPYLLHAMAPCDEESPHRVWRGPIWIHLFLLDTMKL